MPDGKYRIRKLKPEDDLNLWWLTRPDQKVKLCGSWDDAIQAMYADLPRHAAIRNRIPLGPIGTVPHAS